MNFYKLSMLVTISVGVILLVLAVPAYFRYSTIGFDTDRLANETIVHSYVRVRWPGDGTIRFGMGEIGYTLEEEDVDTIDLAGRLLHPPEREKHRSATWGFGAWSGPEVYDSRDGKPRWARWLSLPAWLPGAALLGLSVVFCQVKRKRVSSVNEV